MAGTHTGRIIRIECISIEGNGKGKHFTSISTYYSFVYEWKIYTGIPEWKITFYYTQCRTYILYLTHCRFKRHYKQVALIASV